MSERKLGTLVFAASCAALVTWAALELYSDTLRQRNAYLARMVVAADSLRQNHGIPTFPRLPDDPPGTVGDTLYVWWVGREVKAVWPTETPRRRTNAD